MVAEEQLIGNRILYFTALPTVFLARAVPPLTTPNALRHERRARPRRDSHHAHTVTMATPTG